MANLTEDYRGHRIELSREDCLGGWEQLYYSIYRISDGYECVCDFTSDDSDLSVFMGYMKERIDAELSEADPWGENADVETV